jgi:Tol biopolymer transport system component
MKRRLRDIGDARPYLEESPAEPASISTARSARSRHARPLFVTIGAVALLLLGGIAGWILKKVPATPRMASSSPLPNGQLMTRDGRRAIDISPDGTRIAYIADGRIYLQYLHNFEVHPIPGSELVDPIDLAFSSDGQSLVFYASRGRRGIRTIPVIGGPGEEIVSLETPTFGIRWQDDSILFSTRVRIQRHDVRSGQLDTLFEAAQDEEVGHPQLIDGGRRLLYTVRPGTARWNDASIVVQSVTGGERQVLVRGGTSGRLLSNDVLLYRRDATLYAQRIDRRSLQPEGKAVEVLASVVPADTTGGSHFGVSDNGTLVFFQGLGPTEFVPVWVDRKGQEETLKTGPRRYCGARISPNGKRIAFEVCGDNQDIMVWDTAARTFEALTSRSETDSNPIWYDDDSIIYRSNPGNHGVFDLYQRKVHSALAPVSIVHQPGVEGALDVSVGGKWLLFREGTGEANGTLKLISLAAGATPVAMADQAHNQVNADISPDDRWIAYETDEDGTPEIWIRPLQRGSDVRWKVSQAGGRYPVWATAHELIYVQDGRHVTVVTVPDLPPGAEFQSAATVRLPFDASRYLLGNNNRWFDVSRHDGRFLMLKIENSPRIAFITGWLDELTARIAAR